jgi:hypothetical protein
MAGDDQTLFVTQETRRAQMRTRNSSPTIKNSGSRPANWRDRRTIKRGTPVPIALM